MSPRFKTITKYYDKGHWTKSMVGDAVVHGWITDEEYELITGEPYVYDYSD